MFDLRMPDVNSVLIAGNLTRNPSFRRTTNGTPVTNFWIASNRRFKDNNGHWRESVCYVGVVAWYKLAENCAENLRKSHPVVIEGELQSRSLRTEDGYARNIVEIKARRVQFLNKKIDESKVKEEDQVNAREERDSSQVEGQSQEVEQVESIEQSDEENPEKGKYDFGYQNLQL